MFVVALQRDDRLSRGSGGIATLERSEKAAATALAGYGRYYDFLKMTKMRTKEERYAVS